MEQIKKKGVAMVTFKKLTPVMYVDDIKPCLAFWISLGFELVVEVPEGDHLGFVILTKDALEIMIQSRASLRRDIPPLADMPSCTTLYIDVSDLDATMKRVSDAPVVLSRRKTFYGADEFAVREPGGNVVMFSQH